MCLSFLCAYRGAAKGATQADLDSVTRLVRLCCRLFPAVDLRWLVDEIGPMLMQVGHCSTA